MKNEFLKYLLKNEPTSVISKRGIAVRKSISPLIRNVIAPLSSKNKYIIDRNKNLPNDRPLIFAATHGLKDDIACGISATGTHAYLLFGSLPDFFGTIDGPSLWLNGVILVDRKNKQSRRAAKPKMNYALSLGTNILMFPEGTLNKTENLIVQKLFPGVYDVAKQSGALVVPVAIIQEDNKVYAKVCDAFDITQYERQEGLDTLRDLMATAKYELMEKYSRCSRADIGNAKEYWKNFLDDLVNQMLPFYDYEIENSSQYLDKTDLKHISVKKQYKKLKFNKDNVFLLNKRNIL
ncbi:lysophospholipid acyltransferase family protein [Eubacterium sp.]|uniref:lysophospholipid acyltransferase family protein n=1 Tax=Eubacterium sp. TaxID=142586 RepID=UPI003994BA87